MTSTMLRHPARLAGASLLRLQSDERLAELALHGHEAAFAAIVDRYRGALLRYSAGIVGAARAEDAVQQALINAHDALKRTTEVRHLRSWLYRITHNATLNVLRSMRDDLPLDPAHAALGEGPDATFERREQLRATLAAVRDLPERQRAALLLRELEGRSHEEIAAALGVTKGAARQQLMRARATVRTAATALTPYPLIAKLAAGMAAGPSAAGWAEVAAGAGAGVTLTKLSAGVVATGALLGGAVGAQQVVDHHRAPHAAREAARSAPARAASGSGGAPVAAAVVTPAALTAPAARHDSTPSGTAKPQRDARQSGASDARGGRDGAANGQTDGGSRDDHGDDQRTTTGPRELSSGDDHGGGSVGGRSRDGGDRHSAAETDAPESGTTSGDGRDRSGSGSSGSSGDDGRSAPSSSGGSDDEVATPEPDVSRAPGSGSGSGSDDHAVEGSRSGRGGSGSGSGDVPAPTVTAPPPAPEH